jgi:cellulose biosynthesis protein BcsQ
MTTSTAQKKIIDIWSALPPAYSEGDLQQNLVVPLLNALDISFYQIKITPNISAPGVPALKPDLLVYQSTSHAPVLVIENKKRIPTIANTSEPNFTSFCLQNSLYKDAVGYQGSSGNGIKQYLSNALVDPGFLASYGLVFNGDFFQLWRRVDGLVFPLTPIQKVTKTSIPLLMYQLAYCLQNPQPALVAAVWNQKGGVAKTTNVINFGAALALQGKKVLLIDLDPQNDLTRGLGVSLNQYSDYLDPCIKKLQMDDLDTAKKILDVAIQSKKFPTTDRKEYVLSVLSATTKSLNEFRDDDTVPTIFLFKKLINLLKPYYDYIFIDASPTFDKLTQCVLFACDTVSIPVDYGDKSLHHGVQLYQSTVPQIREIRAKNERLHLGPWNLGLVFSNCSSDTGTVLQNLIQQNLQNKNFAGKQCSTHLKNYSQAKIAEFKHAPAVCWQNSPITKLYTSLIDEIFLGHNFTDH